MVICGHCQSQNSPKARFCAKCGVTLQVTQNLAETEPARNETAQATVAERPEASVTVSEVEPRADGTVSKNHAGVPSVEVEPPEPQRSRKGKAKNKILEAAATALPVLPSLEVDPLPEQPLVEAMQRAEGVMSQAGATDVQPLLYEEAKLAQIDLDTGEETPLRLWLNFPRALVAGYGSIVEARLENAGTDVLENTSVLLESNALTGNVQVTCRQLTVGNRTQRCVELSPEKAGNFVLRCTVRTRVANQECAFRGTVPITINVAPDNANLVVNISDIQCVRGGGANTGLGQEFGAVNISNLLPAGAIRTLNDLLNVTFPESFGKVLLELDYEVSVVVVDQHVRGDGTSWSIPKPFLSHAQTGTKLKLEPIEKPKRSDGSGEIAAIHLVARDAFKLGRSRTDADFLAWFWPEPYSPDNVARTKRLTQVHAVAEARGDKLILRDHGSTNGSTFEGHTLSEEPSELLDQRGTLILGHEYHLDVTPFASSILGGLRISNIRTWSGPAEKEKPPARGAVRFMPLNSEVAVHNAVWIFTDANFGCSRLNPIVLDLPGAAEVEGRFSYFRKNFWVETLPTGHGVQVGGYKLSPLELVPIVNGAEIVIAGAKFRATIEP